MIALNNYWRLYEATLMNILIDSEQLKIALDEARNRIVEEYAKLPENSRERIKFNFMS